MFLAYEIQVNTNAVRSSTYAAYNDIADSYWDFVGFREGVWRSPGADGPFGLRSAWAVFRHQAFSNEFRLFMDNVIIGDGAPLIDSREELRLPVMAVLKRSAR